MDDRDVYHLLYVDGWDHQQGEAVGGGRCVGSYEGYATAMCAFDAYRRAVPLMWGPGHLVLTTGACVLCYAPSLPALACA